MSNSNIVAQAARTTITRDLKELERSTGNIYETIVILSKRANQISAQLKEELSQRLQEFATAQDNLEEVFENREQIEVSRHYERLPKPHAIAIEELLQGDLYVRRHDEQQPVADQNG
jgi:DNA-directed RNA polymerase subunit K/omega